jgi:dienelactone hydrolase
MPIEVTCAHCRQRLKAPSKLAGKRVKCPTCQTVLEVPNPQAASDLTYVLEEVVSAPPVPATGRPGSAGNTSSRSPLSQPPVKLPAGLSSSLGNLSEILKTHVWTIVTVLCGIPSVSLIRSVWAILPSLVAAAFVFLSEHSRRTSRVREGLTFVDRILLGVGIGLSIVSVGFRLLGILMAHNAQQAVDTATAVGYLVGFVLGSALVLGIFWLVVWLFARSFGLGRTVAVTNMVFTLVLLVWLGTLPAEGARDPLGWAKNEAEKARQLAAQPAGVNPVGAPGQAPLDRAAAPGLLASQLVRESMEGDIRIKVVSLDSDGRPGSRIELHIFYPASKALADHKGRKPCVFIAPAGSNLLTGKSATTADYPECLPWAQAGYLTVLYSLAGSPDELGHAPNDAELTACFDKFKAANAGLANFEYAQAYVRTLMPQEADVERIITVGHSSAAVVALLAAESDPQVTGCVVFGTIPDLAASLGANRAPLEAQIPGLAEFLGRYSPQNHVNQIHCPLFLFHANDDQVAPVDRVQQFVERAKPFCPNLNFMRVATGGHHDAMIREGIPRAIQWLSSSVRKEAPGAPQIVAQQPNPPAAPDNFETHGPNVGAMQGLDRHGFDRHEDPEKKLQDRLKTAFTFNPARVRDLVAARLIVGDDERLVQAVRRAPVLGRPVISLRLVLGTTGLQHRESNSADWMKQGGARREFLKGGGDFAQWLIEGINSRTRNGSLGDWAADVGEYHDAPPSVLFANDFSEDGLQLFAAEQKADVLIALNYSSKASSKKRRVVTMVARVFDVSGNTEIWASNPLTSTALIAGRNKGKDPAAELVTNLLSYFDDNLALQPAPALTPADVEHRAEELISDQAENTLSKVAEIRAYQSQQLLTAEQATRYYSKLLNEAAAEQLASDEPTERFAAILDLIPDH